MKSISLVLKELGELIKELDAQEKEYEALCKGYEKRNNLDFEQTEDYGVFTGKKEKVSEIKTKLLNIIKE